MALEELSADAVFNTEGNKDLLALYHDPSRAAEANQYLLSVTQSAAAWDIAEALLASTHADVRHFAACSLHQHILVTLRLRTGTLWTVRFSCTTL